jgi:hypothetical protein
MTSREGSRWNSSKRIQRSVGSRYQAWIAWSRPKAYSTPCGRFCCRITAPGGSVGYSRISVRRAARMNTWSRVSFA